MAAFTRSVILNNSTAALFRAWTKLVSDTLIDLGWIRTADTGQIDFATVAAPGAANTAMGYEIWRMNDSLQATSPVFMKIEYGSGASAPIPSIWLTVGIGSNGTGGITGYQTTRNQRAMASAPDSATFVNSIFSGNTSRFTMYLGFDTSNANQTILVNIERTKDSAGNETAEGFIVVSHGNISSATAMSMQFISQTAGLGLLETGASTYRCVTPSSGGSSGSEVAVFPIFPSKGILLNPLIGLIAYFAPTIAAGSTPQFNYYGALRTYIPIGTRYVAQSFSCQAVGTSALILYE